MSNRPFPTFHSLDNGQIEAIVSQFLTTLLLNTAPDLVRCALESELDNWSSVLSRVESFQQWELSRFGVASTARAAEDLPPHKRPLTDDEIKSAVAEFCSGPPLGERFSGRRAAAAPPDNRFPSLSDYARLIDGSSDEPLPARPTHLQPSQVAHVRAELQRLVHTLPLPTDALEVRASAYAGAVLVKWSSGASIEHIWIDPNGLDLDQVLRLFVARCAVSSGVFDEEQAQRFCDSPLAEQISFTRGERMLRRYQDLVQLEDAAERELSTPPPAAPVERRRRLSSIVARCTTSSGLFELLAMQWWARDRRGIAITLREVIDPDLLEHLEGKAGWIVSFKLDNGAIISNGHPDRWWNAFVELADRIERLEAARGVLLDEEAEDPPLEPRSGQAISTQRGRDEASGERSPAAPNRPAGELEREGTPEAPSPTERSRGQGGSGQGEPIGQGSAGCTPGGVS